MRITEIEPTSVFQENLDKSMIGVRKPAFSICVVHVSVSLEYSLFVILSGSLFLKTQGNTFFAFFIGFFGLAILAES